MSPGKKGKRKQEPGPKPERLKVEGDWEDAVKHALKRPKPPREPQGVPPDKDSREPTSD